MAEPAPKTNLPCGSRLKALGTASVEARPAAVRAPVAASTLKLAMLLCPRFGTNSRLPSEVIWICEQVLRSVWPSGRVEMVLECGQAALEVHVVGGHAAALFVGEVHHVQRRVVAVVPGTQEAVHLHLQRVVGREASRVRVELELVDHVGAGYVLGRLQHVVLYIGNVRHVGEPV